MSRGACRRRREPGSTGRSRSSWPARTSGPRSTSRPASPCSSDLHADCARVAERWVAAAVLAKGIAPGTPTEAEEWFLRPVLPPAPPQAVAALARRHRALWAAADPRTGDHVAERAGGRAGLPRRSLRPCHLSRLHRRRLDGAGRHRGGAASHAGSRLPATAGREGGAGPRRRQRRLDRADGRARPSCSSRSRSSS